MARNYHKAYPQEFKLNIVELIRSGRSINKLAKEYELSPQSIRTWLKQADVNSGRRVDGLTSAEREEISKLRKQVRQLEIERDILKKALAIFGRHE